MNRFSLRNDLFKFTDFSKIIDPSREMYEIYSSIFINQNRKSSVDMEPVGLGNTRSSKDFANEGDEPVECENEPIGVEDLRRTTVDTF